MDTQVLADAPASSMPLPPPAPAVLPRRPALHGAADFVSWTWEMVNAGYDDIGWSADGSRITIKKPDRLASLILPLFFRHSQYASWVRALNAYHFKKVGTGQWHHPCFHRDRPELLKKIVRKPREPAIYRRWHGAGLRQSVKAARSAPSASARNSVMERPVCSFMALRDTAMTRAPPVG